MVQAVRDLQELHAAVATESWGYEWLAAPAVAALVHLVSACMLRPSGKLSQASAQLEAGQQLIAESLERQGVRLKVSHAFRFGSPPRLLDQMIDCGCRQVCVEVASPWPRQFGHGKAAATSALIGFIAIRESFAVPLCGF